MPKKFLLLAIPLFVLFGARSGSSQWRLDPNLAPSLLYPVVNNPCLNGKCGDRNTRKVSSPIGQNPAKDSRLTYRTSTSARRANLAKFIAKIRTTDPASATQIEQLFASK